MVGALTPTNVARVQIPVFKAIILCGLSLLLVQVPLLREVFSPGTPVFTPPQNQFLIKFQFDQ